MIGVEKKSYSVSITPDRNFLRRSMTLPHIFMNHRRLEVAENLKENTTKVEVLPERFGKVDTTSENDDMFTHPIVIQLSEECF